MHEVKQTTIHKTTLPRVPQPPVYDPAQVFVDGMLLIRQSVKFADQFLTV